jgi:hypothetical protein
VLYTIIPAGTVPDKGLTELTSLSATRGASRPLLVLSISTSELELMVLGLSPIFIWAEAVSTEHTMAAEKRRLFFIDF